MSAQRSSHGRRLFAAAAFSLIVLRAAPLRAVEPDEILPDPALEARAREVSRDLRCLVCQSQSIDDSDAPLAKDLRLLVRERIVSGDTNEEARDFVVARYGDYVLLRPRLSGATIALWGAPAALLLLAGAMGALALRRRKSKAPAALSSEEERRLKSLLE
jgi:cytochrome c-type biogenesis protein CcmH